MSNYGNWGNRFGTHVPRKTTVTKTSVVPSGGDKENPMENEVIVQSQEMVPYKGQISIGLEVGKSASFAKEKLVVFCSTTIVCDSSNPQARAAAHQEGLEEVLHHIPNAISAADSVFDFRDLYLQTFIKERGK